MFLEPGWAGAKQRKSPEVAPHGLPAQSQAAHPEPGFLLASTENEAKMPNPAVRVWGKLVQRRFTVGRREWTQGCCLELRQWLFIRFPSSAKVSWEE